MGSKSRKKRCQSVAAALLPLAILLVAIAGLPDTAVASRLPSIEGIVESASGTHVAVRGNTYDIGHATVRSTSGISVSLSEVARGRKVKLYLSKGKVTAVVVYPADMIE